MFVRCKECGLHQPQVFFIFKGKAQCPNCHLGEEYLSHDATKPDLDSNIVLSPPKPIGDGAFVFQVFGMGVTNLLWLVVTTSNDPISMNSQVKYSTLLYVGDSGNYADHQALWTFPKPEDGNASTITMKFLIGLVIEAVKKSASNIVQYPYTKLLESVGFREMLSTIREQAKERNSDRLHSEVPHTHFRIQDE